MELAVNNLDLIVKLAIALFLGMCLGIERVVAGKIAGMRTYGLVTMGSALFTAIGIITAGGYDSALAFKESIRLTAQIISGIGFIGAGLILFNGAKVSGVTTAAGIWVSAGVGVATGYGLYTLAIVTTIFALLTFTVLWYAEDRLKMFIRSGLDDKDD
jgi:putative Mg2+ transporter-C (MgtC) family protein